MSLFENIRDGKEPATIVYKDDYITAFEDIYPEAPVHILIIPNKTIKSLNEVVDGDASYLSNILLGASKIAKLKGIGDSGYRLITNCNHDGGQEIEYLHFHLVGGVRLGKMISLPTSSKKKMKQNDNSSGD